MTFFSYYDMYLDMTTSKPEVKLPKVMPKNVTAASLANLIPYKPGQNGHGRVYPLKLRLQHALDHPLKAPKPDAPAGEHIVYATLKGALECEPSFSHLREVWDRVEGKIPDKTIPTTQVNIVFVIGKGYQQLEEGKDANR